MTRRFRGLVVIGVAVTLAGGASAAVHQAIERQGVTTAVRVQPVVVAARAVPLGAQLAADDVKTVDWPSAAVVDGTFASVDDVIGRAVRAAVVVNEPLTADKIAAPGAGTGLPPAIPAGMRAISVKVDEVVAVAGFATPGSRVDVLVAFRGAQESVARAVASNVQVLAVGTRTDAEQSREYQSGTTVVTLLVTPENAERISLASMQGTITLTLRNPLDDDIPHTDGVRLGALVGESTTAPPRVARAPRTPVTPQPAVETVPAPRVHVIQTIRAGKRAEEIVR